MRNLFTNHKYSIPHEKFTLWFFGDIHYGVESCDVERLKWFVKRAMQSENPYFVGMGDFLDFASFSGNKKANSGDFHEGEEEWFSSHAAKDVRELFEILKPLKGRIIGMIGGNHQFRMSNGQTTDEYLCELLETKYLGWLSVINVMFESCSKGQGQPLRIFACHGKQGGKLLGTSLNGVVDMSLVIPNADIYVSGHDHQRMAVPKSVLMITTSSNDHCFILKQKRQYFVRSGSFQKSYVVNTSGFAQSKLMKPADLGAVSLNISTHRGLEPPHLVILDIEGVV